MVEFLREEYEFGIDEFSKDEKLLVRRGRGFTHAALHIQFESAIVLDLLNENSAFPAGVEMTMESIARQA